MAGSPSYQIGFANHYIKPSAKKPMWPLFEAFSRSGVLGYRSARSSSSSGALKAHTNVGNAVSRHEFGNSAEAGFFELRNSLAARESNYLDCNVVGQGGPEKVLVGVVEGGNKTIYRVSDLLTVAESPGELSRKDVGYGSHFLLFRLKACGSY
ncbi:unnamed protein product [Clonostachys byssicola]|uniref:Uncharacterized protein n=1 Tax=Clonostachys byssicola TaxID=160290 RepID=A0A9N9Y0Q1_9HYPO|nr:unnamed protein product [Clonostachys byssicola]